MGLDYDRYEVMTFDCFGTLIDWESGLIGALAPFREKLALELSDDEILEQYAWLESTLQSARYRPYREVLRQAMEGLILIHSADRDDCDPDAVLKSFGTWPVFADTVDALRVLSNRFKLAILSNVDDDPLRTYAENAGNQI